VGKKGQGGSEFYFSIFLWNRFQMSADIPTGGGRASSLDQMIDRNHYADLIRRASGLISSLDRFVSSYGPVSVADAKESDDNFDSTNHYLLESARKTVKGKIAR